MFSSFLGSAIVSVHSGDEIVMWEMLGIVVWLVYVGSLG